MFVTLFIIQSKDISSNDSIQKHKTSFPKGEGPRNKSVIIELLSTDCTSLYQKEGITCTLEDAFVKESTTDTSNKKGLSRGALIGVIIGSVAWGIAIAVCVFFLL